SATPSIRPIAAVRAPSTLSRYNGRSVVSISLETSVKKLVRVTTQTFLGSEVRPFRVAGHAATGAGGSVIGFPRAGPCQCNGRASCEEATRLPLRFSQAATAPVSIEEKGGPLTPTRWP